MTVSQKNKRKRNNKFSRNIRGGYLVYGEKNMKKETRRR